MKATIIGILLAVCVCAGVIAVWQAGAERARTEAAIAAALEEERARAATEAAERIEAILLEERARRDAEQQAVEEDIRGWQPFVPTPGLENVGRWPR